jgi:hypothetical protein
MKSGITPINNWVHFLAEMWVIRLKGSFVAKAEFLKPFVSFDLTFIDQK